MIPSQFAETELIALRQLVDRYFEIKEYGLHVWGRTFYERMYVIRSKIDEAISSVRRSDHLTDEFGYIDLKIMLNIVRSEAMGWAANEAPNKWPYRVDNEPVTYENAREIVFGMIMVKLRKRIERQM